MRASLGLFVALWVTTFGAPASADFYEGLAMYDLGEYEEAAREWSALAKRGDAQSLFYLSELYAEGKGVAADRVTALLYLNLAKVAGHPEAGKAFLELARESPSGDVAKAHELAIEEWTVSAGKGDIAAMLQLAKLFKDGKVVPENRIKAMTYLSLAMGAGYVPAESVFTDIAVKSSPDEVSQAIEQALAFEIQR